MCPFADPDGSDDFGPHDQSVPCLAGCVDHRLVGLEDPVGKPVLPHVLPDVFRRVHLWRSGRQEDQGDVSGNGQVSGRMPAGPVEQEDRVCAAPDIAADLVEMMLHGLGVGMRHHQGRAGASRRTDGAEQIGALIALIGGQAGARTLPCPDPRSSVLLADAAFVLEPDFHLLAPWQPSKMGVQRDGEVFLNMSMTRASCCGCFGRPEIFTKPNRLRIVPT